MLDSFLVFFPLTKANTKNTLWSRSSYPSLGWLIDWWVDWLFKVYWLIRMVDWLIGWLMVRLIGRLVDWLIDWLKFGWILISHRWQCWLLSVQWLEDLYEIMPNFPLCSMMWSRLKPMEKVRVKKMSPLNAFFLSPARLSRSDDFIFHAVLNIYCSTPCFITFPFSCVFSEWNSSFVHRNPTVVSWKGMIAFGWAVVPYVIERLYFFFL